MANCNCNNNSTPQPCCQDCADVNPCASGCLDIIPSSCVQHEPLLSSLGLPVNTKLDVILEGIDTRFGQLENGNDKFVKVTALDTVSGYLYDKITTCSYLTKTTVLEGGQQKLKLCISVPDLLSDSEFNPIFSDLDGINFNYTTLVNTIANTPELLQVLCDAISGCTPTP